MTQIQESQTPTAVKAALQASALMRSAASDLTCLMDCRWVEYRSLYGLTLLSTTIMSSLLAPLNA